MKLADVLVIGGGPVGSYVAHELASMAHEVVVLERGDRPGKKVCCTGIISRECARADRYDVNDGYYRRGGACGYKKHKAAVSSPLCQSAHR